MAQSTILAAATAAGTSSDVVVAAGASVTIGLFVASGGLPPQDFALVYQDTPGGDNPLCELTGTKPTTVLSGPGTFRVVKGATSVAVGVFTET